MKMSGTESEVLLFRSLFVLILFSSRSVILTGSDQQPLAQGVDMQEYCEWESFNATCRMNEVIVMGSAKYGRMRLGKCVTKNYGHIGCASDVTSYFDSICSGRHSCDISVIKLHDKLSCPTDFKYYLEASYECVKVLTQLEETCANSTLSFSRTPNGLIASVVAMETGSGTADCPWIIAVEPYQRINVTLFDFSAPPSEDGDAKHDLGRASPSGECIEYAVITEGSGPQFNTSVCGGRRRQGVVFVSSSNTVEIRIVLSPKMPHFLLKYEAVGCSPLAAPSGAWVLNSGSQAVVRCNDTEESWRLTCRGRSWDGYLGNCSTPIASVQRPDDDWVLDNNFPYGILLVIALGVLIGVAAGVLMLLAVLAYMRRRRIRKVRSRSNYVIDDPVTGSQGLEGKCVPTRSAERRTPIFKPSGSGGGSEVFVGRQGTWQRTRPLPVPVLDSDRDVSGVGIAMMPVTPSELPLLSPYSLEEPITPSGGIFGTFGPGYHEQCINLLRRSSSNSRPAAKGVGAGPGVPSKEQGPYYFKLDLTERPDNQIGGGGGGTPQCIMCQAGPPRESRRTSNAGGLQGTNRQLDECYQY